MELGANFNAFLYSSSALIKLSFNKINNSPQDTATISISNAVFYDTNGDSISVNQIKEGLVVIQ